MYSEKFIHHYFCLVLLIGGLGYTPWILHSYGIFPSYWFLVFILIGGASSTLAALIASRLEFGKKGPEQLFNGFNRKGFTKLWFFGTNSASICYCIMRNPIMAGYWRNLRSQLG